MSVLVGIDEAGFGPLLGPLVVSSSSFSVPEELISADLWQVLKKSLAKTRKHMAGRLLITDSKKAYNKSQGIKHLERATLSALSYFGHNPATLKEVLELLDADSIGRLEQYLWYQQIGSHSLSADTADIKIASSVLADDLTANKMKLLDVKSYCLDVVYYNTMVEAVKNKATVLFTAVSQLIKRAYDKFGDEDLHIVTDRQGGREHYRKNLQRMFPDLQLKILCESPATSSYELSGGGKSMQIHFVVGADSCYLPVSLASMICKYLRELMMENINQYFINQCGDLKPTAGYWQDGQRFLKDLRTNYPNVKFDSRKLIRSR